jgi:predicted transposase YdaD
MRRKDDLLWKGVIEDVFDDLLRFIFPNANQLFDMRRGFVFLDKELHEIYPEPDTKPQTRYVDKLVKVYTLNGREEWLLVHLEVQGQVDRLFPERMFRYYYRIFDRHNKPVTAIAAFTGQSSKDLPDKYENYFLGTRLAYHYNTFHIADYTDEELIASNNPFALVVLAAKKALLAGKIPEQELMAQKLLVAKILLSKSRCSRKKIRSILTFLMNYVLFEEKETNVIFERELKQITGKQNTMGIVELLVERARTEGLEKGLEKGVEKVVENLLASTEFSVERIAALAGVSVHFVKKVRKNKRTR